MASPLSPHPLTIKTTILTGEPSTFTFTGDTQNTERRVAYDVGFALVVLLFIIILTYTSYMCNRITRSRSPPPPTTSFHSTLDSDTDDFHSFSLSTGLEDDVFSNFPTCVYSELLKAHKVDTNVETNHDHVVNIESECSICLSDYESFDVLRLLPECGHLFHVSCIDRWLKIHATCPVCRKSPLHEK